MDHEIFRNLRHYILQRVPRSWLARENSFLILPTLLAIAGLCCHLYFANSVLLVSAPPVTSFTPLPSSSCNLYHHPGMERARTMYRVLDFNCWTRHPGGVLSCEAYSFLLIPGMLGGRDKISSEAYSQVMLVNVTNR